MKENHLFAAPRARVDRFKTDYNTKKANTTEMAGLLGGMVVEIATASLEEFRERRSGRGLAATAGCDYDWPPWHFDVSIRWRLEVHCQSH